jgi:hypothetical protein
MTILDEIEACVQSVARFSDVPIEWWVSPATLNDSATIPKILVFVNFPTVDGENRWQDQQYVSYQITIEYKYSIATSYPKDKASILELHAVADDLRAVVSELIARQNSGECDLAIDIKTFESQRIGILERIAEVSMGFTVSVLRK